MVDSSRSSSNQAVQPRKARRSILASHGCINDVDVTTPKPPVHHRLSLHMPTPHCMRPPPSVLPPTQQHQNTTHHTASPPPTPTSAISFIIAFLSGAESSFFIRSTAEMLDATALSTATWQQWLEQQATSQQHRNEVSKVTSVGSLSTPEQTCWCVCHATPLRCVHRLAKQSRDREAPC